MQHTFMLVFPFPLFHWGKWTNIHIDLVPLASCYFSLGLPQNTLQDVKLAQGHNLRTVHLLDLQGIVFLLLFQ